MTQTRNILDLDDEERELFAEHFNEARDDRGLFGDNFDEKDSPLPWCCPWYYNEDLVLEGDDLKEMAENYYALVKDEMELLLGMENLEARDERYNDLQQVASAISGYDHHSNFSSASDEFYYEKESEEEKIQHIRDYGENVYDIQLSIDEAIKVYEFLESDFRGLHDWYYAFEKLDGYEED